MQIHTLHALKDNFIYMLVNGGECAAVDPGETAGVEKFLGENGLRLTHVLCTHHHWDHVNGAAELAGRFGCEVVASEFDRARVPGCTVTVSEAKPLHIWGRTVRILDVPGHTLGQIAYWFEAEKAVFVGDTLFSAGCGRLFEGTPEQMYASLQKFKSLPPETRIYFGHEYTLKNLEFTLAQMPNEEARRYKSRCEQQLSSGQPTSPTTVQTELLVNPFLRAGGVEEFRRLREARNHF